MSIEFEGLDDFFNMEDEVDISGEIKHIVLETLSSGLKAIFPTLDFYYETIVLNTPGANVFNTELLKYNSRIDYYVSAPNFRGYRILLFSIGIKALENYPVYFIKKYEDEIILEETEKALGIAVENIEGLVGIVNSLLKEVNFRKKIIVLSKQKIK